MRVKIRKGHCYSIRTQVVLATRDAQSYVRKTKTKHIKKKSEKRGEFKWTNSIRTAKKYSVIIYLLTTHLKIHF